MVGQFPVKGGTWKCGRLLPRDEICTDYSIIAEAVAPGFDFHDFQFVSSTAVDTLADPSVQKVLRPFLHSTTAFITSAEDKNQDFDSHYDEMPPTPVAS